MKQPQSTAEREVCSIADDADSEQTEQEVSIALIIIWSYLKQIAMVSLIFQ